MLHKPGCDPSEEAKGKEFKNKGVCQSCNQYLCKECHTVCGRNTSNTAEGRMIQTGDDLQNPMSEKPTSHDTYGDHPHYLQDQLCCDHITLIGSASCCTSQSTCDTNRVSFVPDIKIPNPMTVSAGHVGTTKQHDRSRPEEQQVLLGQIKATQIGTFNVKLKEDVNECSITGIAITSSGLKLWVDYYNDKVKLFSHDMRFLSSVTVAGNPWDITMVNDREAVVTVKWYLDFLEVAGGQLRIKDTIKMSIMCAGITYSKDKLFVTAGAQGTPTEVRALDLRGIEQWSVGKSSFEQWSVGQPLFKIAGYICSNSDGRWLVVTDHEKKTISVLNANTDDVIASRQLEKKRDWLSNWGSAVGISVDSFDNIFVCKNHEILVLSADLMNEHVLFNLDDTAIGDKRWSAFIAYDQNKHQLIISRSFDSNVVCLQLS